MELKNKFLLIAIIFTFILIILFILAINYGEYKNEVNCYDKNNNLIVGANCIDEGNYFGEFIATFAALAFFSFLLYIIIPKGEI